MWPLWDFPMTFLRPVYTMNLEWKLVWNPKKSNKDVYIQKGGKKRTHNGVSFTSKTMAFISNRPHSRTSLACCSDETDMDNDLHQLFSSLSLSLSLGDPSASCVDKLFIRYNIYHFQTRPTTILLILQLFLLRLLAFIIPTKFSMSLLSDFLS